MDNQRTVEEAHWQISVHTKDAGDADARSRILAAIRPHLEQHTSQNPNNREFVMSTLLGDIRAELYGRPKPGSRIRMSYTALSPLAPKATKADGEGIASTVILPDPNIEQLGKRLVGLEAVEANILLRLECLWDGRLDAWATRTGHTLPRALTQYLTSAIPCFTLVGLAGTGKTALSHVVSDRYCREHAIPGVLLTLSMSKGNGLVGNLTEKLRAGFEHLHDVPRSHFGALLIDELDAWGESRSLDQQHKENRDGVTALLREIDRLQGAYRRMVICTTNTSTIDQAVLRRSVVIPFGLPGCDAQRTMLRRWLPEISDSDLDKAVRCAQGLTPADLDRALSSLWITLLEVGDVPKINAVKQALSIAVRTRKV